MTGKTGPDDVVADGRFSCLTGWMRQPLWCSEALTFTGVTSDQAGS